jgi:hypothetical protein
VALAYVCYRSTRADEMQQTTQSIIAPRVETELSCIARAIMRASEKRTTCAICSIDSFLKASAPRRYRRRDEDQEQNSAKDCVAQLK